MEDFRTGTGDLGWRLETIQYTKQRGEKERRNEGKKRLTQRSQRTQSSQRRGEAGRMNLVGEVLESLTPEGVSYR